MNARLIATGIIFIMPGIMLAAVRPEPHTPMRATREEAAKEEREAAAAARQAKGREITQADLPEDTTARITVRVIQITGNRLIGTDELLGDVPAIFVASGKGAGEAQSRDIYDFSGIRRLIAEPGLPQQISARTIQGFTQYILSEYQRRNYAGIYVYVPAEALKGTTLAGDVLAVEVLESRVTKVGVTHYDVNQVKTEKGYLDANAVLGWSPVREGEVTNKKKLDDFVNLLNLNPDRYVTAVVSKGTDANTLGVNYGIYEADPWHYFLQIDNSGTDERQWNPRVGVINTNLLGRDDSLLALFQTPVESDWEDNYSLFGSYDFPVTGPELRLMLYAGYSEFDISPEASEIDFAGGGKFWGMQLRYNFLQAGGWFFDAVGGLSREESRTSPSLFPEFLERDLSMDLWLVGTEIYRRDDMSRSSIAFRRTASMSASDRTDFTNARADAEPYFSFYTLTALHSRYLEKERYSRLSGSFKWVTTEDRLVPAKMTLIGGMYTVRGYDEYEVVADGGVLFSTQYEFDLVRYEKTRGAAEQRSDDRDKQNKCRLKKLAPVAFLDFGRSRINEPRGSEKGHETLVSMGPGALIEAGDNFSGAIYCGFPLKATEDTRRWHGRLSIGLALRW